MSALVPQGVGAAGLTKEEAQLWLMEKEAEWLAPYLLPALFALPRALVPFATVVERHFNKHSEALLRLTVIGVGEEEHRQRYVTLAGDGWPLTARSLALGSAKSVRLSSARTDAEVYSAFQSAAFVPITVTSRRPLGPRTAGVLALRKCIGDTFELQELPDDGPHILARLPALSERIAAYTTRRLR